MPSTKSEAEREIKPLLRHYDDSVPVDEVRSRTMSKIRAKDTRPELALRKALHAKGLRFRIHDKSLPGTPDVSNKSRKVVVFVDGCFWHGCPRHFKVPKTRSEFWREKIQRNREKRIEVMAEYGVEWMVFQFYECEIGSELDAIVEGISAGFNGNSQQGFVQ